MAQFGRETFTKLRFRGGSGSYILLPVLTSTQRDALTNVKGLLIYNSTTGQVEETDGTTWRAVGKGYGDTTFLPLAGGALTGDVTVASGKTIDGVEIGAHAVDFGLHTKVIRKAADESVTNSTTLQNDDELLLAMAANEVWAIELRLLTYDAVATDAGVKFAWSLPSGATLRSYLVYTTSAGAGGVAWKADAETLDLYAGTAIIATLVQWAIIVNGATAGNAQLQWAQNTQQNRATTVKANSVLRATKLV